MARGRHAAPRRPRLGQAARSIRVRALLSLGMLFGITAYGTLAYWSDSVTMDGGTFTSGTLNMQLNGNEGNPTVWTNSVMTLAEMVPGESLAAAFTVDNVGSVAFTYTATGTATGVLAPHLTFQAFAGGAASNPGGPFRTGTCTGTSLGGAQVLDGTARPVIGTQQLPPATSQTVCFVVRLSTTAPGTMQGQSGNGTFVFTANQLGAP